MLEGVHLEVGATAPGIVYKSSEVDLERVRIGIMVELLGAKRALTRERALFYHAVSLSH